MEKCTISTQEKVVGDYIATRSVSWGLIIQFSLKILLECDGWRSHKNLVLQEARKVKISTTATKDYFQNKLVCTQGKRGQKK